MEATSARHQGAQMTNDVVNPNSEHFNFEAWATAVKRQMMTVIKRRGESETELLQSDT